MPIDFLQNGCRTSSESEMFGLCDDSHPPKNPAYIFEGDEANWIAEIKNPQGKLVDFFAVDHCVDVVRENGEKAKRCDGIVACESQLTFVELKDRAAFGWVTDGRKQLTETISFFNLNHADTSYKTIGAQICNKQFPLTVTNNPVNVQKFLDDTGLILTIDRTMIL